MLQTQNGAIVAICRITKGIHRRPDGESIEFEKVEQLNKPITLEELNRNPSLKRSEPLANNHQGSLFRLTTEEYGAIRLMIEATPAVDNVMSFTVTVTLKSLFLSPSHFHLTSLLAQSPGWKQVYSDDLSVIFMRSGHSRP